ncbi:hypothetical protein ACHAXT_005201 [Thalassiosira profunda]
MASVPLERLRRLAARSRGFHHLSLSQNGRPATLSAGVARLHSHDVLQCRRGPSPSPSPSLHVPRGRREPSRRGLATSASKSAPLAFHFGNGDNESGERISLSNLTSRQSAELEDALFARINGADDGRLVDPILGKSVGRKGLDWIRSVALPSSSLAGGEMMGEEGDDKRECIAVTIQPPTLLHPALDGVASNIAKLVQEETASLIDQRPEWFAKRDNPHGIDPEQIGVTIRIAPQPTAQSSHANQSIAHQGPALQHISHFLAVHSCKGGVGKSTVAANLAYALSARGGRVGLADLDVYGPSLPILVQPDDPTVRQSPPEMGSGMVEPIDHRGVKLMSLGYVSPDSGVPGSGPDGGAAVLRGPMAGRVAAQLLQGTNWGHLDVLVLDLPPGTGDVQLEVCQSLSLSGAVAVSTPSALAWADVKKGVRMFGEMGVPTVAVVENMAYFVCEGGGRHYPFGKSHSLVEGGGEEATESAASQFLPGPSHVFHLPISETVNEANDAGTPLCCDGSEASGAEEELETFSKLADAVSTDLLLLQHKMTPLSVQGTNARSGGRNDNTLVVALDEAGDLEFDVPFTQLSVDNGHRTFAVRLFSNEGGYQKNIAGRELRIRDPRTGEVDASAEESIGNATVQSGCGGSAGSKLSSMVEHHTANGEANAGEKDGLFPAKVTKKGNYGYEVEWADGSTIIYSLLAIAKAAGGKPLESR